MHPTTDLTALREVVDSWFPASLRGRINDLLSSLPSSAISRLRNALQDKSGIRFEAISNERILFSALRVLSRVFWDVSEPITVRAEIEITQCCNFACVYCTTHVHRHRVKTQLAKEEVSRLIRTYAALGCKYIHFNGGEVSQVEYLPKLVAIANRSGMRVGMSSNGSGSLEFYRRVVEAGLDFAHISFDAACPREFEKLTRTYESFAQVKSSLSFLCKEAKAINPDLSVVANVVLCRETLHLLPETVNSLLSMGIDDIKLLPSPEIDCGAGELQELFFADIKTRIERQMVKAGTLDMFQLRLNSLFTKRLHGLSDCSRETLAATPCELSTDHVMVRSDGTYAPCFIYMRECYDLQSYNMGTVYDDIITYCTNDSDVLRRKYESDTVCQRCCPDIIQNGNLRIQRLVEDCLVLILNECHTEKGEVVGFLRFDYKDLEAPFDTPKRVPLDYHVFAIPSLYDSDAARILSVFAARKLRYKPLEFFLLTSAGWCLKRSVAFKIAKLFFSEYGGQCHYYKTKLIDDNTLRWIRLEVNRIVVPRAIDTVLCSGEKILTRSNVSVDPVIFQDSMVVSLR